MKNIVLLSDGTGNSAAKRHKTNVWRLYEALYLHDDNQIAMYDDGVGSKDSTPSKIMGGVFGIGLKRNVLELYKYLCRNYRSADQNRRVSGNPEDTADRIFLFGFSRGAFTMRVLAGFIVHAGLCTHYESEGQLDAWAKDNYRSYRTKYKRGFLRRALYRLFGRNPVLMVDVWPDIEFIGVWDTVDAYVMPIDELAALWDTFIYPIRFDDHNLSAKVLKACHALSVDDARHTFHPVLWNESEETGDRIEQVWFPGVHSDVGGGYPRKSLALVSLDWMIQKVEAKRDGVEDGLVFIKNIRESYCAQSDWNGLQHDSRSGFGAYYRYKPRDIKDLCNDSRTGVFIDRPKIHRSVFERIKGRSIPYAPIGIPEKYEVIETEGNSPPHYEDKAQRKKRAGALNFAKDLIFWRRRLYFAFLWVTFALILSRFYLDWEESWTCVGSACFIDPIFQLIINYLPDFATGWLEALRQNLLYFGAFIVLFVLLFIARSIAWKKTQKYATGSWARLKGTGVPPEWDGSFTSRLRQLTNDKLKHALVGTIATLLSLFVLYLLFAALNGVVFHLRYTCGTLCQNSEVVRTIRSLEIITLDVQNSCFATGIQMEKGKKYRFRVADVVLFDGSRYITDPDGFSASRLIPFVPMRRHVSAPWMMLYGKINDGGYETFQLGKGVMEYVAQSDGELFLYVNDAVFGLWPEWDLPYKWGNGTNVGEIAVEVDIVEE